MRSWSSIILLCLKTTTSRFAIVLVLQGLHACPTLRRSSQRTRSISITTPFFLEKTKGKLVDGQIVYAYKYDVSRQAVLVADRPALSDSLRTVLGWVPSDLIAMVGQNRVFLLDSPYPVFGNYQLGSNLLFTSDGNYLGNYEDPRVAINMPLALWDRKKSMMVNAKGEDVSVADLDQLIENSKKMNIHLIFYSQDRMQVRNLLNALQGLEGKFWQGQSGQIFCYSRVG